MSDSPREDQPPDSTAPDESNDPTAVDLAYRRILVAFAGLTLAAGLLGVLGIRETEASVDSNGYELAIRYAAVTRPGLATPFDVTVTRDQPLPAQVGIAVSSSYLAAFDENGLDPAPSESFNDGEEQRWLFDVPEGERRLTVSFDARLEPAVQWTRNATVSLLVDEEEVTAVDLRTWVMP